MDNIVRAISLKDIESFWLLLEESAKNEKILEENSFRPIDCKNLEGKNYILWENKEYTNDTVVRLV